MRNALQSLWAEPRAPQPPTRVWRDWVLVSVLVPSVVLEAILRPELAWRPVALIAGVVSVLTLLWRRNSPLVAVVVAFGVQTVAGLAPFFSAGDSSLQYSTVYLIVLPYALFRWGAVREAVIGLVVILASHFLRDFINDLTGVIDTTIVSLVLLLPAALGASVRYRATARISEIDRVKLREREQLARELHDTVAHHVSAIAIQAQAGRTLAASDPDAAANALEVIEEAASRTLAEMRTMVSALRKDGEQDLAPQGGVADIERFATIAGDTPRVDVEMSGELDTLSPSLEAAIYRLAQESVTNAVRHARHATSVSVRVVGGDDDVRLTVRDDGDASSGGRRSPGYGLVGMTERVTLLGGTLEAGPNRDGGWTVGVVLPRGASVT